MSGFVTAVDGAAAGVVGADCGIGTPVGADCGIVLAQGNSAGQTTPIGLESGPNLMSAFDGNGATGPPGGPIRTKTKPSRKSKLTICEPGGQVGVFADR